MILSIRFFSIISSVFFFSIGVLAQNKITGTVTDGRVPLSGVSILVQDTNNGSTTDENGKYSITAAPKDILVFSYIGKKTTQIVVEDVTNVLNISLTPVVEELDEVVVTKYKRKTQQDLSRSYYSDTSIINTDAGYLSPDLVGYHLRVVDGKDLNTKAFDVLDAIADLLPGTVTVRKFNIKHLFPQKNDAYKPFTSGVNYEVDGNIFYANNPPDHLDIRKVIRAALIYPANAVHIYGQRIGGPGVVVINTSDVNHSSSEDGNRPYDLGRLRDNLYANDALDQDAIIQNGSNYLKELYASKDGNMAYTIYEKYKPNFGSSYAFVLDAYRCLSEQFNNTALADRILKDNETLFETNSLAMKALAYTYQAKGEFKSANELYKQVFIKRPNYVQSYLDLANSYREIADYKKAAGLFSRFEYLTQQGYFAVNDTTMISNLMDREFSNLLKLKGEKILSKNEQIIIETAEADFEGTRLVFEWNDSEAEFELQFVNPEGHYFTSENSLVADVERIRDEKLLGYSTEEFLIDGSLPGTWQVNVKYLGNKQLTPSYLKAVVYYNYGTDAQRKETKIFKMGLKNVNQKLLTLNIPSMITN